MKKVACLFVYLCTLNIVLAQPLPDEPTTEGYSIFSHVVVGFEIGSNFLDIETLNQELDQLDLLQLDPYTNNFTFQVGFGLTHFELYNTFTVLATNSFSRIIGADRLFLSSTLNGNYIGFGIRGTVFSILKNRLSLMASADLNTARYDLRMSRATIFDRNVSPLLDSSQAILARSSNRTVQPALELLYAVVNKKNRFDIGFRVGYIYHLREESWENQHGVGILGLSPIRNNESFNVALRFVYSFARCGRRYDNYD
ncbi:hypothetical protein [Tunicatimonas pelagia]|uniref:hypothetical protein n=1 Tax=Tunicatimonas pelagia TaxID=931531 RepID=UPI002666DAE8|nr:hypothetical protein [Tunicatimonas pelagia]WKN44541.1 hypothetical protein P0M28_06135 [Tunicatimonas pelagia]